MKKTLLTTLIPSLILSSTALQAADYSAGLGIGAGLGATFSVKNALHIREDDQLQSRFELFGGSADAEDDLEFSDIDYKGDLSIGLAKATMDWYPYSDGWARKVFFTGGLVYSNLDIEADAELHKSFRIGDQQINPGDIQRLHLDIEHNPISPYLGVGWGNKIGDSTGWSFFVELGVGIPTSDPDFTLTLDDANNVVSAADLEKERRQLEDDLEGPFASGTIAVTYHF